MSGKVALATPDRRLCRNVIFITDTTMVVGVDIGSQTHYARAFDNRGRELTR